MPDRDKRVFRFLSLKERWLLQGHDPGPGRSVSQKATLKFTGNAFPVPMLGAVLLPLLRQVLRSWLLSGGGARLAEADMFRLSRWTARLCSAAAVSQGEATSAESLATFELGARVLIGELIESFLEDENSRRRRLLERAQQTGTGSRPLKKHNTA